mmetsp:Transcript_6844/g.17505  ORF Transcript_6844/g.17505 Transcript_6844/m.17505 type:complete len:302 (-) Transcript_6844:1522-2427(-)
MTYDDVFEQYANPPPPMRTIAGCVAGVMVDPDVDNFELLGTNGLCQFKVGYKQDSRGPKIVFMDANAASLEFKLDWQFTAVQTIYMYLPKQHEAHAAGDRQAFAGCIMMTVNKPPQFSKATARVNSTTKRTNTEYTTTTTDMTPNQKASKLTTYVITVPNERAFQLLADELRGVDELKGKLFIDTEPPTALPGDLDLNPKAARIGRIRGIPPVESHSALSVEFMKKVDILLAGGLEKLTQRRVPIWVSFLSGPQYSKFFPEHRDLLMGCEKLWVEAEALLARTEGSHWSPSTAGSAHPPAA